MSLNTLSPRKDILHNIDDIWGSAALTIGDWKVLQGSHYNGLWDGWYGPAGLRNDSSYDMNSLYLCPAGKAIININMMPTPNEIRKLRNEATIDCFTDRKNYLKKGTKCEPMKKPCLFNIKDDPCEQFNLAER